MTQLAFEPFIVVCYRTSARQDSSCYYLLIIAAINTNVTPAGHSLPSFSFIRYVDVNKIKKNMQSD